MLTSWSLSFDPLLPLPVVIAFAVLALVLVGLGLVRRVRGSVVRSLAVLALLASLFGPAMTREERAPLKGVVAVIVDESQSQDIGDRAAVTRAALETVRARIAELPDMELREIHVGPPAPGTTADGTRLFEALGRGLADVPPDRVAGAILITDGQVHDVPASATALGFGAPVHGLVTGRADEIDRRLVLERAPRFGLVGSTQLVRLRIEDQGAPAGGTAKLTVRRDGETVIEETVPVGVSFEAEVQIAHAGPNILEFEVAPLAGELSPVNNSVVVVTDGVRENLRVLLVSGSPHAGERTWRNLLKSDPSVDLVHFTILRPPEKQDGTPINQLSLIAFPTRELFAVKINEFDLIIFDRYQRQGVLPIIYFDNIARYVKGGGAVLVAAGPDYADDDSLFNTPLGQILPAAPTGTVLEQPYRAGLTPLGKRHPVTRGLPGSESEPPDWSRWFRLVVADSLAGSTPVLQGPEGKPALVLSHADQGRVALFLSDQAWLWARGYEGGGPHVPLLRRLAHWLMREPELEEEALRLKVSGGDLVVERQTLTDAPPPVTLKAPSGAETRPTLAEAEPGLWRATIPGPETGLWRATDGKLTALVHVGPPNPREFTDLRSTTDILTPIAEATGGAVRRIGDGTELPRILARRDGGSRSGGDWIGLDATTASVLIGIDRVPVFAGFLGLAILLGLVSATWWREGR